MADQQGEILWFRPDPRGIIPLDTFHVPHGLRRTLKKKSFEIWINREFEEVMRACADRDETWINEEIIDSYVALHHEGWAHSVEAWSDGELVGGLYGVSLGGAFFGESMFSRQTDASKVALCALVERMKARGFKLLDTQWKTDHLDQFGAVEVAKAEYLVLLERALAVETTFLGSPP